MSKSLNYKGCWMVLGPAWSGKTAFVVDSFKDHPKISWIGTGLLESPEMSEHISSLKKIRPSSWKQFDESSNLIELLRAQSSEKEPLIIDSVSQWIVNEIYLNSTRYDRAQRIHRARDLVDELCEQILLQSKARNLVIVSAEMGASVPPEEPLAYDIRRIVGEANQKLAFCSSRVTYIHAGIGTSIKD